MITDYYIPCEQQRATEVNDSMGIKKLVYAKIADINGVIIQSSERKFINGVWQYVNTPVFLTNDVCLKLDRIVYKNIVYNIMSDPNDVMERGHHYEFSLEAVI